MDELVTFDGASAHRRTTQIPAGEGLLVTDTLAAPGTFVLSHHLARALRDGRPAVLLSFNQPRSHYAQILQKAVRRAIRAISSPRASRWPTSGPSHSSTG